MRKAWLTALGCLLALGSALGRADTLPQFNIKSNLSLLLHPQHPGVHLAIEYGFAPHFSIQLEGGPQLPWRRGSEPTTTLFQGYRLRPALRYALPSASYNDYRVFLEALYEYRYTKARIEGDFWRDTPLGSFQQRILYDFEQRRNTFSLNIGIQQAKRGGFLWELGGGLGYYFQDERFGNVPTDASFITNGAWHWRHGSERSGTEYAAMMYFSLGYRF